jgi:hypothetical protein
MGRFLKVDYKKDDITYTPIKFQYDRNVTIEESFFQTLYNISLPSNASLPLIFSG